MNKAIALLFCIAILLAGCGSVTAPTATPDRLATEVALAQAVAATLTAAAPSATAAATATATILPPATSTPPVATPSPLPIGPSVGRFAVAGVYGNDSLNVRALPGTDQDILGQIPYSARGVEVFAGDQKVGNSWWVPVRYGRLNGWVNRSYLASQVGDVGDTLAAQAAQAILAIRDHNLTALANLVHPVKGVTFSPYSHVRPLQGQPGEADMVFSRDQLRGLWADATVYHWGYFDGTGLPIDLSFRDYYTKLVYDVDFAQPEVIGFGEIIGRGNTLNNIADVWPGVVTIEYHFSGFDPKYGGMDWRSLRLVFEEYEGSWFLVGIAHAQWTV